LVLTFCIAVGVIGDYIPSGWPAFASDK